MEKLELYSYCKSSAAYRVRIALNLKNVDYIFNYVSLTAQGGENFAPEYLDINPQAMVPSLKVDGNVLTQSSAIIEWLEENYPMPSLLPYTSMQRAQARSLAQIIACDIHPLNNLRVLDYIKGYFQQSVAGVDAEAKHVWYQHWIQEGFDAFETILASSIETGDYCIGNTPTIADVYLVPQVFNAIRFNCDLDNFPTLMGIYHRCTKIDAFFRAAPEQQEDYS